ncbi:MAG: hypothetical protein IIA44_10430 [Acidobacteria bacterium]|nr:hypothetical protein [Acidobacteriota bacterium]
MTSPHRRAKLFGTDGVRGVANIEPMTVETCVRLGRSAAHVFKGSLVGVTAGGYARPLVAGDLFAGFAYEEMDNSGGSDGDVSVRVYTLGDFGHGLSGATVADIGNAVYASADDTLTFTSAGNSYVGSVVDVPTSGEIILRLDAFRSAP